MTVLMSKRRLMQQLPKGIRRAIQKRRLQKAMEDNRALLIGVGSLVVVAGVATAIYLIRQNRRRKRGELPSRRATRLNVENPGAQNEFVGAASESEIG